MENKKLSYWKWLQKDNVAVIIVLTFLGIMMLKYVPDGKNVWIGYLGVIFIGIAGLTLGYSIWEYLRYRRGND